MHSVPFTFDPELHLYRDAEQVIRPSVSQAIKAEGFISFAGINPAVLARKAQLGTLVHKVTELYDAGEDLTQYEIPDEVWPYFEGWLNFENDTGFRPRLTEFAGLVQVNQMWYGMRLDCEGLINGEEHIVEKKCGSSEHPAWGIQTAAYDLGLAYIQGKLTGIHPYRGRTAVQMGPQFSRNYKTHPYHDPVDYFAWVNSLFNTIWKINKNIPVFDNIDERMDLATVA